MLQDRFKLTQGNALRTEVMIKMFVMTPATITAGWLTA